MANSFDFASLEQFIESVLGEQRDLLNVGEIVDPTAVPGMDIPCLDGFFDPAQANEMPWRNLDGNLAQGGDLLNFEDVAASSRTSEKDPSNFDEFNALIPWEPLDLKGQTKLKWNGSSVIGSERHGTRLQNMDEVYSLVREVSFWIIIIVIIMTRYHQSCSERRDSILFSTSFQIVSNWSESLTISGRVEMFV